MPWKSRWKRKSKWILQPSISEPQNNAKRNESLIELFVRTLYSGQESWRQRVVVVLALAAAAAGMLTAGAIMALVLRHGP